MRVAVISDIHGNAQALQAVLAAIEAEAAGCGVVPRGHGRLRATAERVLLARPGRCRRLPRRQPRPARARQGRRRASSTRMRTRRHGGRSNVLDEPSRAFSRASSRRPASTRAELFHASARDPVWEYVLGGESALADVRADRGAARPRRPQPRPVRHLARGRRAVGRACSGRNGDRPRPRPMALQSGLRRSAAGRRRARRMAARRFRRRQCVVSPSGLRPRGDAGSDPRSRLAEIPCRAPRARRLGR